ncbi:MAG: lysine--tRNA ligase, partial [Chitinophagaceae bacterium]|nr:lysine--tRNA ligase [Chitinophagaceae bacterium]
MSQLHLSEQELIRREKLVKLRTAGIDPYPASLYPVTHYSQDIKSRYTEETKDRFTSLCLAGRIMSINDKGKVFFLKIQDSQGIIQLYVKRDDICPENDYTLWDVLVKHGLDLGDIIGVTGFAFVTKTGETSVHVQTLTLLSKSLKPLPVVKRDEDGQVHDAVTDPEFRYRQRYADLVINPAVRETFVQRTRLVNTIRQFLNERGAIEVDTPVLQSIPGGAAARPFITHHNALDIPFYLRIANELYLKRLIVGGFDWVYEFSRNFRNEGMDRTHNPEFTVLEWYTAYKDYIWMMEITEQLFETIALTLHGTTDV